MIALFEQLHLAMLEIIYPMDSLFSEVSLTGLLSLSINNPHRYIGFSYFSQHYVIIKLNKYTFYILTLVANKNIEQDGLFSCYQLILFDSMIVETTMNSLTFYLFSIYVLSFCLQGKIRAFSSALLKSRDFIPLTYS